MCGRRHGIVEEGISLAIDRHGSISGDAEKAGLAKGSPLWLGARAIPITSGACVAAQAIYPEKILEFLWKVARAVGMFGGHWRRGKVSFLSLALGRGRQGAEELSHGQSCL